MTGVKSVVATFNAITYPLSVTVVGKGHVSSDQPDIHCPEVVCTANFAAGTQVTLRATPDAGWEFAGWSGACTGTTACVVTMTQARSVTATFVPAEVQARVVRHNIVYTANNRRQLRVTVDADEDVRVVMKIRRGGVTLQQRTARVFGPDVRVLRMNILQDIRAGTATLRVTFTNDARAQETVVHTLKIPQPKQLG
jgi:hypothetical protein